MNSSKILDGGETETTVEPDTGNHLILFFPIDYFRVFSQEIIEPRLF